MKRTSSFNKHSKTAKKNPAISVVIPMYNTEKYIGQCLESILGQTYQDFEIIVVDDGSTDSSAEVVESYIPNSDGKINLFRMKKNSGNPGTPLNKGVELARGKYVYFMDSDDLIADDLLRQLYILAERFNAEVAYMDKGFFLYNSDSEPSLSQQNEVSIRGWQQGRLVNVPEMETENLTERVEKFCNTECGWPAWEKMVLRSFLIENKIHFPEIAFAGHVIWSMQVFLCAKKFLRTPNPLYCRRVYDKKIIRTHEENVDFFLSSNIKGL